MLRWATSAVLAGDLRMGRRNASGSMLQGVVTAAGELAGDRDRRQLGIEPIVHRRVVAVVGAARAGDFRSLEQRPAQSRRALPSQEPTSARRPRSTRRRPARYGPQRDRNAEASTVAELGPDRHRQPPTDTVLAVDSARQPADGPRTE